MILQEFEHFQAHQVVYFSFNLFILPNLLTLTYLKQCPIKPL